MPLNFKEENCKCKSTNLVRLKSAILVETLKTKMISTFQKINFLTKK